MEKKEFIVSVHTQDLLYYCIEIWLVVGGQKKQR